MKFSKKSILALASATLFAMMVTAGCGKSNKSAGGNVKWPGKNISYIMTASAGGGLDICARMLSPYWEKSMGGKTVVTVENVTGGANWVGWNKMMTARPDGNTVVNVHTPQIFSYLNKALENKNTLDSFNLLCNCVTDNVTIAVRADDTRFANVKDLKDLVNKLKSEPTEYTVSLTSKGGADELALLQLKDMAGIKNLRGINHSNGIAVQKTSFLGGDCDIYFGKVGDTIGLVKDGKAKILAVCKNKRSEYFPNTPTAKECGFDIIQGSSRGIATQKKVPADVKAKMVETLREAQKNPEYLKSMKEAGYEVDYMDGKEYEDYMKKQEAVIIKFADQLGYNNKK